MLTVFGLKNCDACCRVRKYFSKNGIEFLFHDVRDDGLDDQMLMRWANRLNWAKLLNKRSLTWRKIPKMDRMDITADKAFALMIENPTLVKRPVIESDKFIAVGYSEKHFGEYLND